MFEWLIHSMKAIYNSRITEEQNIQISANNRGFRYGDGLFETIVTGEQRINLVERHLHRIIDHARILSIDVPISMLTQWANEIESLTQSNGIEGNVRTKIMLWRAEGGLYAPSDHGFEYLITQKPSESSIFHQKSSIGICESAFNQSSLHAKIKSLNALHYVLAGIEMKRKGLDEIILIDDKGRLSETHIGNLFWIKNERLFTPSLSTGCIEGIMRGFIIDFFQTSKMVCQEVEEEVNTLDDADCIFSTNASGIAYFAEYKNDLTSPLPWIEPLIKQLQQP